MSNALADSISTTTIQQVLQDLLESHQRELAESRQDNDTRFNEYWECACRSIYEVAAALKIPFHEPWVDPFWELSAEYQAMQRTTRAEKRQGRKREIEQTS